MISYLPKKAKKKHKMGTFHYVFLYFIAMALLFEQKAKASGGDKNEIQSNHHVRGIIGAIVDNTSRAGKEARVAMEMAICDFNDQAKQRFLLQISDSHGEPVQAALAARDLIFTQEVDAVMGPHSWEESSLIADIGSQSHVPIVSLSLSTPRWATKRWPFLIQASPTKHTQMRAIAAIVQSWEWHRINVIYEDTSSASDGVIPHLFDALKQNNIEISHFLALSSSSSLEEELERLKKDQCRVFVVHMSIESTTKLFESASKMEMMAKGYVWIVTDTVTSLIDSFNVSTISSMQGVLGVKSYFSDSESRFQDFNRRFGVKFRMDHPEEESHVPSLFAVRAYDATWAVSLALSKSQNGGQSLLEKFSLINFNGLIGKVKFLDKKIADQTHDVFQIVNVIGKSYREFGFWSNELGFSETINETAIHNSSMQSLGQVFWPGGPLHTPTGWSVSESTKPLIIGVPTGGSSIEQFVNTVVDKKSNITSYGGFSIEIFKATVEHLPYHLPYEFSPFNGTYNELVEQVYLKKFNAVVGDVAIVANRCRHAEFTHPYTESGLVMIVPVQSALCNKALLFLKPFTNAMWVLIPIINIYNGFVVWLIERNHCPELKGSPMNQIGTLLWLGFTTLFSLQGAKLHSNLSRMAMVVWLFVALVITQSYTASLTSMLTVQRLEPTIADIETLKTSNAMVGYASGSFVSDYLVDVLQFKLNNIKHFTKPEHYAQSLKNGSIMAAFLEVPPAKLFLAKYCKSFIIAGPTYEIGGFGFAFPKGSPILGDVNEALLKVSEEGKFRELENMMTVSEKCVDVETMDYENAASLNLGSFSALFLLTGGTSTVALAMYMFLAGKWKINKSVFILLQHKNIWTLMLAVIKNWGQLKRRFSRRVSDTTSDSWTQV